MKILLYAAPDDEEPIEEIACHSYTFDDFGFLWIYRAKGKPEYIINMDHYAKLREEA